MSSASDSINEPPNSMNGRIMYELTVKDSKGKPAEGIEVVCTLEGRGSFVHNFSSKEIKRQTDASGAARFTWYRSGAYDRDAIATVTVTSPEESSNVTLARVSSEEAAQAEGPRIDYIRRDPFGR